MSTRSSRVQPANAMLDRQTRMLRSAMGPLIASALSDPEIVEIIPVPLHDRAALHRCIFNRHKFVQRAACDDHAADMLREVAGEPEQLAYQLDELPSRARPGVQPRFLAALAEVVRCLVVVGVFGQSIDQIERKTQCLTDIPNR